jgi:predicted metal-dependent enzyme (double-stranded beta helix superfamily)
MRESDARLAIRDVLGWALAEGGLGEAFQLKTQGIEILHHSHDLTVLHAVWPPLVRIYPHDHRMWAAIAVYSGREDNTFFRRDGTSVQQSGGKVLQEGDVMLVGDDVIHAVENPNRAYTGAVHVYGGDFFAMERSQWTGEPPAEEPYNFNSVLREFELAEQRFSESTSQSRGSAQDREESGG